jgi:predicted DNA-binding WGR domain protein
MRRLELSEGTSNKFWEVSVEGTTLAIHFGRIGTNGQLQAKVLDSSAAAETEMAKLVAEKLKKGYHEVTRGTAQPKAEPVGKAKKPDRSAAATRAPEPKSEPEPKTEEPSPSPLETGFVASMFQLFQDMMRSGPSGAVWSGKVTFPKGALANALGTKIAFSEETVRDRLTRLAADVSEGRRFLDLRAEGDKWEIQGWDWLPEWEKLDDALGGLLEVAAQAGAKGKVETHGRFPRGEVKWVTRKLAEGEVAIDEGEKPRAKPAAAALAKVQPALDAWFAAHPRTRFCAERTGKLGFIDRTGREVIEPRFSRAYEFSDGLAVVFDGWKCQLARPDGALLEGHWQNADLFLRGRAPVAIHDSESWGYVDGEGQVRVEGKYGAAYPFFGPLAVVLEGKGIQALRGIHRWITPDGELVGEPFGFGRYEAKCRIAEGRVWTFRQGLSGWGCVDEQAQELMGRRFYNVTPFSQGLAAVVEEGAQKWGYIDRDGKAVIDARFDEAFPFAEDRALVRMGSEWRLIDKNGKPLGKPFDTNAFCGKSVCGGMLPVAKKDKIGFVDKDGEPAIAPRFVQAYGFFEDRAYVGVGENAMQCLWGHIDRSGAFTVEPTLVSTNRYFGGLAPAQRGPWWGFIDLTGKFVVEPQYRTVQPFFADDRAYVQLP